MANKPLHSEFYQSKTIIVNGEVMTAKEYKAYKKAKNGVKPRKRGKTQINIVGEYMEEILKGARLMKSLSAYYDNGYQQWGNICKEILELDGIRKPFIKFRIKERETQNTINMVETKSRRNCKAVYDYLEKLGYDLDDIATNIDTLANGIIESGIINRLQGHECINGKGRRLGLQTLVQRTNKCIKHLQFCIKEIERIREDISC